MMVLHEQTREEKMKMYMRCPKKELADMLINCNDALTMALKREEKDQSSFVNLRVNVN